MSRLSRAGRVIRISAYALASIAFVTAIVYVYILDSLPNAVAISRTLGGVSLVVWIVFGVAIPAVLEGTKTCGDKTETSKGSSVRRREVSGAGCGREAPFLESGWHRAIEEGYATKSQITLCPRCWQKWAKAKEAEERKKAQRQTEYQEALTKRRSTMHESELNFAEKLKNSAACVRFVQDCSRQLASPSQFGFDPPRWQESSGASWRDLFGGERQAESARYAAFKEDCEHVIRALNCHKIELYPENFVVWMFEFACSRIPGSESYLQKLVRDDARARQELQVIAKGRREAANEARHGAMFTEESGLGESLALKRSDELHRQADYAERLLD